MNKSKSQSNHLAAKLRHLHAVGDSDRLTRFDKLGLTNATLLHHIGPTMITSWGTASKHRTLVCMYISKYLNIYNFTWDRSLRGAGKSCQMRNFETPKLLMGRSMSTSTSTPSPRQRLRPPQAVAAPESESLKWTFLVLFWKRQFERFGWNHHFSPLFKRQLAIMENANDSQGRGEWILLELAWWILRLILNVCLEPSPSPHSTIWGHHRHSLVPFCPSSGWRPHTMRGFQTCPPINSSPNVGWGG